MRVVLTRPALRQLDEMLDYVSERSPQGAKRVSEAVWSRLRLLSRHPLSGQTTDRPGLRRLLASPYPYVIFYRVEGDTVFVQGVRHTSRRSRP